MKFQFFSLIALISSSFLLFVESVVLDCDFQTFADDFYYGCIVRSIKITSKLDRIITEVKGEHMLGKSNEDVHYMESNGNIMRYFPQNLGVFFKNLEKIHFNNSTMRELRGTDLQQLSNTTKQISIQHAEIEILESDVFDHVPNVEVVSFHDNNIKHVDDGVFTKLLKLNKLYFAYNNCTSMWSTEGDSKDLWETSIEIEAKCKDQTFMLAQNRGDFIVMKEKLSKMEQKITLLEGKVQKLKK